MQRYTSLTKFNLCQGGHQTWSRGKFSQDAEWRGLTAGFHQLSIKYTRDASVKLSATPPAFRLTRKMVTCTLFTKDKNQSMRYHRYSPGLTKMLNNGITRFRTHRTLKSANLKAFINEVRADEGKKFTENPARCRRNAIRSKKLTNWLNTMLFVVVS
jgi:hypothetical protein